MSKLLSIDIARVLCLSIYCAPRVACVLYASSTTSSEVRCTRFGFTLRWYISFSCWVGILMLDIVLICLNVFGQCDCVVCVVWALGKEAKEGGGVDTNKRKKILCA